MCVYNQSAHVIYVLVAKAKHLFAAIQQGHHVQQEQVCFSTAASETPISIHEKHTVGNARMQCACMTQLSLVQAHAIQLCISSLIIRTCSRTSNWTVNALAIAVMAVLSILYQLTSFCACSEPASVAINCHRAKLIGSIVKCKGKL